MSKSPEQKLVEKLYRAIYRAAEKGDIDPEWADKLAEAIDNFALLDN